jgi:hypothetical protein
MPQYSAGSGNVQVSALKGEIEKVREWNVRPYYADIIATNASL